MNAFRSKPANFTLLNVDSVRVLKYCSYSGTTFQPASFHERRLNRRWQVRGWSLGLEECLDLADLVRFEVALSIGSGNGTGPLRAPQEFFLTNL